VPQELPIGKKIKTGASVP